MTAAIEVKNLTKWYRERFSLRKYLRPSALPSRKNTCALDGVNFSINEGETVALLGPNGAGKSTLLKILASLVLPDEGKASVNGFDVSKQPEKAKGSLSLVIGEERSFYWRLSAQDNLEFFATLHGFSKKQSQQRIKIVTEKFKIDFLEKRYQELSTGMKNRLALARSALTEPSIVLMDEPTRSLDPGAASDLRCLIQAEYQANPKRTLFLATHNLFEADELADRIIILNQGKIAGQGTLQELSKQTNCFGGLQEVYSNLLANHDTVEVNS